MNGGTTAGGSATPVVVSTADDLASRLGGSTARVIRVSGTIRGDFQVGSNKTVVGTCGAEVRGSLTLKGVSNVVIRNLKVVGHNCSDSPRDCSSGKDAISVLDESRNIWFDHLDVSDGSDGNLDVTQGSDFVTISWTKFSYASRRTDPEAGESGHRFSNLIGASDSESRDPGHLNVTFHHCWWANNVDQRMPRTRRGKIHLFNNLFTSSGNSYCTNAGFEAKLLVENNIYVGVDDPLDVSGGSLRAEGNVFRDTTGNRSGSGSGFSPTYTYTLEPTAGLEDTVRTQAGPR
jgi:pectate lyase